MVQWLKSANPLLYRTKQDKLLWSAFLLHHSTFTGKRAAWTCCALPGFEWGLRWVSLWYLVSLARESNEPREFTSISLDPKSPPWNSMMQSAVAVLLQRQQKEMFQHAAASTIIFTEAQWAKPRYTTLHWRSWSANPHSSAVLVLRWRQVTTHRKAKWTTGCSASTVRFSRPALQSHQPSTGKCCLQHRHALTQQIIIPSIKLAVVQKGWKMHKGDLG